MIMKVNSIFLLLTTIIIIILVSSTPVRLSSLGRHRDRPSAFDRRQSPSSNDPPLPPTTSTKKSVKPNLYTNYLDYAGQEKDIETGGGARPFKPVDFLFPDTCKLFPILGLKWKFTIGYKTRFWGDNYLSVDDYTMDSEKKDVWSMLPIYGGQEDRKTRFGKQSHNKELKRPIPRDQPGTEEERKSKTDRYAIGVYTPSKLGNKWVRDFICVEKGEASWTDWTFDDEGNRFIEKKVKIVPLEYEKLLLNVSNATIINGVRMKDLVKNQCIWIITDFIGYQKTPWRQLINEQTAQMLEFRTKQFKFLADIHHWFVNDDLYASDEIISQFPDYSWNDWSSVMASGSKSEDIYKLVRGKEIIRGKYLINFHCDPQFGDHANGAKRYDKNDEEHMRPTKKLGEWNPPMHVERKKKEDLEFFSK